MDGTLCAVRVTTAGVASSRDLLLVVFAVGLLVSITLAQTALTLLAARLVYRIATGRARRRGWPLLMPFAAWGAASLLSASMSARPLASLVLVVKGLVLIGAFYAVLETLDGAEDARRLLWLLLGLAAAVSTIAILQVTFCVELLPLAEVPGLRRVASNCFRARGFYGIAMTLGGVLSMVLLASLLPMLQGIRFRLADAWSVAAWVLVGIGLGFSFVRGAWLGVLVGAAVALGLARRRRLMLAASLASVLAVLSMVPGMRERALSIADLATPSTRDRVEIWTAGVAMFRDHPFVGVGPGQVGRLYPAYALPDALRTKRGHLHNSAFHILVERGPLALAAWIWIFVAFFREAARRLRASPTPEAGAIVASGVAAVAGFLVGGLTEHNFGDAEVALVAYTVMACTFSAGGRATEVCGSHEPTRAERR